MKKILVPTDFSECSVNALRYAAAFAKTPGASVSLLHVADPDLLVNELKGNIGPEHLLELLLKEEYLNKLNLSSVIIPGRVTDTILTQSQQEHSDLIVMGTLGAGVITDKLFGTHTSEVIADATCPVLAIPSEANFQSIRKIVLAVDLDKRTDELLEHTILYFKELQASILLVFAGPDTSTPELEKITAGLKDKTGYHKILCKVLSKVKFNEGIENFCLDIEADLLVTMTHHRTVFESIFDPSHTRKLVHHTSVPVMAIPFKRQPVFFF